jgi:homoserine dehydrogenase
MNSGAKQLSIGMLGCGVVGSQVARLLQDDEQELSAQARYLNYLKLEYVLLVHVKV